MSKKIKQEKRVWHVRVDSEHVSQEVLGKIQKSAQKALGKGNVVLVSTYKLDITRLA